MTPEIITGIEQGTDQWRELRRGIPTCSKFSELMTPVAMKASASQTKYIDRLLVDCYYADEKGFSNSWMDEGTENEPSAREWYQLETGNMVQEVSFVYGSSERTYGASPDGLVGEPGGLEIKCPSPAVYIGRSRKGEIPNDHITQIYGCLFVTQREWWDYLSYSRKIPGWNMMHRVHADDPNYVKWANAFKPVLDEFLEKLAVEKEKAEKKSPFPHRRPSGVFDDAELDKFERQAARAQAKDAEKNKLLSSFVDTTAANSKS